MRLVNMLGGSYMVKGKRILVGISGSFCNHRFVIDELRKLVVDNELRFVVTENVYTCSTRFYQRNEFIAILESMSDKPVIHTIVEAEKVGPENVYDIMIVVPCTATQCAKFVHGIYDGPLTLAMKAMIRNQRNVVIGFASNDGLGTSGPNFFSLFSKKHVYMLPIAQDAPYKKELSIVADWSLLEETIAYALENKQLQPILREAK